MHDARNFLRVDFKVKALLQGEGVVLKGEVKDLSLHGVFLETTGNTIPVGTPVDVTLYLTTTPEPVVINVRGSVVRTSANGIGCVFDKMDNDSFAHLRSIITYQGGDGERVLSEYVEYMVRQDASV